MPTTSALMIFNLLVLSIFRERILKSLIMIMNNFSSFCQICFIYLGVLLITAYTFRVVISFWLIISYDSELSVFVCGNIFWFAFFI